MEVLTAAGAAEKLGISTRRVIALIHDGRLPARKVGRDYIIDGKDLRLVQDRRPGRPANRPAKRKSRR